MTFEQLKDKMTLALAHLRDVMNLHGDLVQNNGGDA